jgi:hypothetical protein
VAARKSTYKAQLNVSMAKVVSNCNLAQTALTPIRAKEAGARNTRTQTYTVLATRLSNMVQNLGSQSTDASALISAQKLFNDSVNRYIADAQYYRTAMDDLVAVDCTSDAPGFMATLLDARAYRAKLATDVAAIKATVPPLQNALNTTEQAIIKKKAKH